LKVGKKERNFEQAHYKGVSRRITAGRSV